MTTVTLAPCHARGPSPKPLAPSSITLSPCHPVTLSSYVRDGALYVHVDHRSHRPSHRCIETSPQPATTGNGLLHVYLYRRMTMRRPLRICRHEVHLGVF